MTEPSEEELERAERIRKLRSGGAKSRGREMRERRRDDTPHGAADSAEGPADTDDGAADTAGGSEPAPGDGGTEETGTRDRDADTDADEADESSDDADADAVPSASLAGVGDTDVLELADDLPEGGSLFVVPVTAGLRREFTGVAEQLHLRYGFEYGGELDAERHVRPLALYLGVQALEDADVETVRELLSSVDELAAPDPASDG